MVIKVLKAFLYVATFLSVALSTQAQDAHVGVVSRIGCRNYTVEVIDSSGAPANLDRRYFYGDGSDGQNGTLDTSHVYTDTGSFVITQVITQTGNGENNTDRVTVRVVEPQVPDFEIYSCASASVRLQVRDNYYEAYFVDWGDGNGEVVPSFNLVPHDYAVQGAYNVSVLGLINSSLPETAFANVNCGQQSSTVPVINSLEQAVIDEIFLRDSPPEELEIRHTINPDVRYFIERSNQSSGMFTIADTLAANQQSVFFLSNTDIRNSYEGIRITAFDACSGATLPSQAYYSMGFNAASRDGRNEIAWTTETSEILNFTLYKDGQVLIQGDQNTSTLIQDSSVFCGATYCYNAVIQMMGGYTVYSDTLCVTASSSERPPGISQLDISVVSDSLSLAWDVINIDTIPFYQLKKGDAPNLLVNFTQTTVSSLVDGEVNPNLQLHYYTVNYFDSCGNQSLPGVIASNILLKDQNGTLLWNGYAGWESSPSTFVVEQYDSGFNFINQINVMDTTLERETSEQNQLYYYRVVAIHPMEAGRQVFSNFIRVINPSVVLFPTAFTPNGDGLNDRFTFVGRYIIEYVIYIYDRWGGLIFVNEDQAEGWDGTKNGELLPGGVYIYKAKFKDEMGKEFERNGKILLLR